MNKKLIFSCLIALLALTSNPSISHADIVTFELLGQGGDFDFEVQSDSFTDSSGLVATFEAFVDGSTGIINAAASGFGVNAENGFIDGNPNDATAELDGDQGEESFSITFSGPVSATLTEVAISGLVGSDAGTIDIGGVQNALSNGTSTVIPTHTELVDNTLTIAFTGGTNGAGNGFSVDSLTFHVKAVPEPSSLALLSLASLGFLRRRRR